MLLPWLPAHVQRPRGHAACAPAQESGLESRKGSRHLNRKPGKRGGVAKRRGVNREHDCLPVARDRTGQTLDYHTGRGRVPQINDSGWQRLLDARCLTTPADWLRVVVQLGQALAAVDRVTANRAMKKRRPGRRFHIHRKHAGKWPAPGAGRLLPTCVWRRA
jgi:hypothetical protein